jgi:hypothetical protein
VARLVIAYKFLAAGRVGPFTGFHWEPGTWVEASAVDGCRTGIHACRVRDLPIWLNDELWEVELEGEIVEQDRKVVALRGRLDRRVESWTAEAAGDFGRFCVRRTRERVGFLPVLSGFVGDVERFVSQRRFAIAGLAAARAAELRDGPAAYQEERQEQAHWLAERLRLEPQE